MIKRKLCLLNAVFCLVTGIHLDTSNKYNRGALLFKVIKHPSHVSIEKHIRLWPDVFGLFVFHFTDLVIAVFVDDHGEGVEARFF